MTDNSISIITCSFNSIQHIEQTITSVIGQTFKDKEYIIIDGGSCDGTIDIIKKYDNEISHWISEPDNGISDAMNKGVQLATNNYTLFLHSDDYLPDQMTLERAASFIDGRSDLYLFQVFLGDLKDNQLAKSRPFGWWTNFKMGSCHQGQICSRNLFTRIGGFDTDYNIVMDYDFFLRAYKAGANSRVINVPLSVMRLTGISSQRDWNSLKRRFDEERRVHFKYCRSFSMRFLYTIYWKVYQTYRKSLYLSSR